MTTLAQGSSATVILRDGGSISVATNGGFGTVAATPNGGTAGTTYLGPAPVRQVFGPYPEGATVVVTNTSCVSFDFDSDRAAFTSADCTLLGLIGDSRMAQSYVLTNSVYRGLPNSIVSWACGLSQGRIRSGYAYNKAVSGSVTADLAGQLANLLAVSPRCTHVAVLTGTNDFVANESGSAAWGRLSQVLGRIREAGMQAIVIMDLPRTGDVTWTTARRQNSLWFNQLVRQNAFSLGAWVVDPSRYISDPASATGDPLANYMYDGIHPATTGAYYAGKDLCDMILSRLPVPYLPGLTNRADVYNATNNPLGSALSNGLFTGTGGTNTTAGGTASGTVADGWNNRTLTGTGTSDASLIARTDGKPGFWQQLVQTSNSGTSTYRFSPITAPAVGTNYPASGSLVLEFDLDVSSATGLEALGFTIYNWDGSSATLGGAQALGSTLIASTYYPLPSAFSGRFRTDPLPYDPASPSILVRLETQINTGAATIKVGNVEVRPV